MANVRPIEWHETICQRLHDRAAEYQREIERNQASLSGVIKEITELQTQINRAKAEGKLAFDSEKYNKGK